MKAEWAELVPLISLLVQVQMNGYGVCQLCLPSHLVVNHVTLLRCRMIVVAKTHGRRAHTLLHLTSLNVFDQLGNSLAIDGLVQADIVIMVLGKDARSISLT